MAEKRGSIAFFSTYRPPIPLNLFARPFVPNPRDDEYLLVDNQSYNYNGREIPKNVLKTLLKHKELNGLANDEDVEMGHVTGLVFVSERYNNLEALHFGFRIIRDGCINPLKVYRFGELYDIDDCKDDRMEDSGCFAGDRYFIFVSTHQRNEQRRQPWTAVYRTDLLSGETTRLTPQGVADFSPSVSPSGTKIAVATLEKKDGGWTGEIENLDTSIAVMDVEYPYTRKVVLENAGWPSWGSDDVMFFHRSPDKPDGSVKTYKWAVYRANFGEDFTVDDNNVVQITSEDANAMTPAAIDPNLVAVSIIPNPPREINNDSYKNDIDTCDKFRHIQVFYYDTTQSPPQISSTPVTQNSSNPCADHFNPFIIRNLLDSRARQTFIGYSRLDGEPPKSGEVVNRFDVIKGDDQAEVGVIRVPGVFPAFTKKGDKLAFVDNDFQNVYLVDITAVTLNKIFSVSDLQSLDKNSGVFSPVWNQNDEKDILYVCVGPAFHANKGVDIYAIFSASNEHRYWKKLTTDGSNNAFPFTNPEGTKLVFRSTRDWRQDKYGNETRPKNLYIMQHPDNGDSGEVRRLTYEECVDTHCQWSPNGEWIVFSSTRDKSGMDLDNGLDLGYFAVYLIKANSDDKQMQPVRVIHSSNLGAGHVNHPMFSPDEKSLVFTSDLAGVSVEPISLPIFIHSVRPYGDIFRVQLKDTDNIEANQDIKEYTRVTHSRYENSTPNWACIKTDDWKDDKWKTLAIQFKDIIWRKLNPNNDQSCPWKRNALLAGQLGIEKRYC